MTAATLNSEGVGAPPNKSDVTRIARAALSGFELARLPDGAWLASRWGMFRVMADDEQVERFLSAVGAPA